MRSLTQTKTYYQSSLLFFLALICIANVQRAFSQNTPSNVVSFTLVNADTDTDIGILNDGDTLYLNNLPSSNLNIRANTSPSSVDHVTFDYNGVQNYRSEGMAPYALFGDKSGDYNDWTPSAGSYTLNGTSKLNGVNGPGHLVSFYVTTGGHVDCNGDLNGSATLDDCGICSGGNTGLVPNADKDHCGVCFGNNSCNTGYSPTNPSAAICGNFPGGRIAMASDGNNADADDHGATAFSIAMLHYAGLLDKLVFIGHSSLYKSPCKNAYGNWCDLMDSASTGAMLRFGGDTSIIYSFKDDYDDNNQLNESINALTQAINASSPGDPLWIYCAGPMDVVYRAINNASKSKRSFVKCISHSTWNENSTYGGLSYTWANMKNSFTSDGVEFYDISDQNRSNGNQDFAQESNGASEWNWLAQSGNPLWSWLRNTNLDIWLQTQKNKVFDISDAGMMYWLISGGPQGGCENCGPVELEQLFKNPCAAPGNACSSNQAGTGSIVNPIDGATFSENASISITAKIVDPDHNTSQVRFYVDHTLRSSDKSSPYSKSLSNLDTGYHDIYAQIVDSCGAVGYTDTVRIHIEGVDCAGVSGGSAYLDNCGNCVGGTTGNSANNSCQDCAGVPNGTASIDNCGVCAGGTTGITPGASCAPCVANQVQSLILMQSGNAGPIRILSDGDIINTTTTGTFSIAAEICNNGTVGSVVFNLDGDDIRIENIAPYAINGDNSNGFKSWNPGNGTYVLTATPYSSGNANGTQGVALTITITITDNPANTDCNGVAGGTASIDQCGVCSGGNTGIPPNSSCADCNGDPNGSATVDGCGVCSGGNTGIVPNSSCGNTVCSGNEVDVLMLIDASSAMDLGVLQSGDTIDLSILPYFSVRAEPCDQESVESVVFKLNASVIRTESVEPYAVNGDNHGGYHSWPLSTGTYTLEALPYSSNKGKGTAGKSKIVTFHVVNSNSTSSKIAINTGSVSEDQQTGSGKGLSGETVLSYEEESILNPFTVEAYPNPTHGILKLDISSEYTSLNFEVYDLMGHRIQSLASTDKSLQLDLSALKTGMYLIKVFSGEEVKVLQVFKQ